MKTKTKDQKWEEGFEKEFTSKKVHYLEEAGDVVDLVWNNCRPGDVRKFISKKIAKANADGYVDGLLSRKKIDCKKEIAKAREEMGRALRTRKALKSPKELIALEEKVGVREREIGRQIGHNQVVEDINQKITNYLKK